MAQQTLHRKDLIQVDNVTYEIPKSFRSDMRVPARVFMNERMMEDVLSDRALSQLINVATLPGIQRYAFAMPDVHQGYGFPIGGVAAMAIDEGGVISPGGIGYDINCGVRLLAVDMSADELQPHLRKLAQVIFKKVPSGVGRSGYLDFKKEDLDAILLRGAHRMVELGYGTEHDLIFCEEQGRMLGADSSLITDKAKNRGRDQLGTLGSGNHFLEIQRVDEIFDSQAAETLGLRKDFVTVMIHCGSRGLGHQTCTDYVRLMMNNIDTLGYELPDRELIYAPFTSALGIDYFAAMSAAANYAWANRHMIAHWVREAWHEVIGSAVSVRLVYDVSHNIGKQETHMINGQERSVIMHRKGATRAFGPGRPEVPPLYQSVGQPVLIPGTMGTASYVLVGTTQSMDIAFGSSCHGAGRRMSRMQAKKSIRGSQLRKELEGRGIVICSDSDVGLAEESPVAYKNVEDVVDVVHTAHLAHKVARVKPMAVIKGD